MMHKVRTETTEYPISIELNVDKSVPIRMDAEQVRVIRNGQFVYMDTTENWGAKRDYIPSRGDIIVYTDHGQITDMYGDTINVPGIKIADGSSYLIDQPFVGADVRYQILTELREHTGNTQIHVTPSEKEFWNNKLNCIVDDGNLVLNRL